MAEQDPYVYPGTAVLRNHFDLRDASELQRRENGTSALRVAQLYRAPLEGRYDLTHLKAFHGFIFGDVYPWAGELRSVAIAKGDLFALPQHIAPYLDGVLAQLPAEDFLRDEDQDRVVDRLTFYLAEINSVHPFVRATAAPNARSSHSSPTRPAMSSTGPDSIPSTTSRSHKPLTAATTRHCAQRSLS